MDHIVSRVFYEKGIKFIFSTRSKLPWILREDGSRFFDNNYKFQPGKDEYIRKGKAGYIVSYGDMLYRSLDAVERFRVEGVEVGLINKSTLNVVDEDAIKDIGSTGFVLVVESLNQKTALGSKVCRSFVLFAVADHLQDGHMAIGAWSDASLWLHGHYQGRLRRTWRANPLPKPR